MVAPLSMLPSGHTPLLLIMSVADPLLGWLGMRLDMHLVCFCCDLAMGQAVNTNSSSLP